MTIFSKFFADSRSRTTCVSHKKQKVTAAALSQLPKSLGPGDFAVVRIFTLIISCLLLASCTGFRSLEFSTVLSSASCKTPECLTTTPTPTPLATATPNVSPTPTTTPNPTASPSATPRTSYEVYSGCESPDLNYKRTIYIDPVNGVDTHDSLSQATATRTLEGAISKVKPGDRILLMPGTHRLAIISNYNAPQLVNSASWILVESMPEAVHQGIELRQMSRWILRGIKFENQSGSLLGFTDSKQVVAADSVMQGIDNSESWSVADWLNAPRALWTRNSVCASLLRNQISNVRFGISVASDALTIPDNSANALVKDNNITNVSGDHLRFLASNSSFINNKLSDAMISQEQGDANHDDAAQGFALPAFDPATPNAPYSVIENILFEGNTLQDITHEGIYTKSPQGFSVFDGVYKNVTIRKNNILTCHYHGITLMGVDGALIEENKVISTCLPGGTIQENKLWISAPDSKKGVPSQNVVIRNNYVSTIGEVSLGVALQNNTVVTDPASTFKVFDRVNHVFDLTLK